jgi:hypothetical protein
MSKRTEPPVYPEMQNLMTNILTSKRLRREELVKLPYEKKIEIVIELQKLARAARIALGQPPTPVWGQDD